MNDAAYRVESLERESFLPYGRVLISETEGFAAVLEQPEASGWLAGINNVTQTVLTELHFHTNTWECFAPLEGSLLIAVAPPRNQTDGLEKSVRFFSLSAPVAVAPNVPHCLLVSSTSGPGKAFVSESANVTGARLPLSHAIAPTA